MNKTMNPRETGCQASVPYIENENHLITKQQKARKA